MFECFKWRFPIHLRSENLIHFWYFVRKLQVNHQCLIFNDFYTLTFKGYFKGSVDQLCIYIVNDIVWYLPYFKIKTHIIIWWTIPPNPSRLNSYFNSLKGNIKDWQTDTLYTNTYISAKHWICPCRHFNNFYLSKSWNTFG